MPAVLTHKSIMLLTRARIRHLRRVLEAKVNDAAAPLSDLERRVLWMAAQADDWMTGAPIPSLEVPQFPQAPFNDVNKFAVMGSMGPDITAFSHIVTPGQAWVFDTVHKGGPDQDRERINARTTDFVFRFFSGASHHIDVASLTEAEKNRARDALRAYTLGHLCHIAGDIISHPYVNDLEWHVGSATRPKFSHHGGEGSIDAQVARLVLQRASTREGQGWDRWWPTVDEVPEAFWVAYADALSTTYETASSPPGHVFEDFLAQYRTDDPPQPDAAFVKDGYRLFRQGVLSYGYGVGQTGWFFILFPLVLPILAYFPLAPVLPSGGEAFRPGVESGRGAIEWLGFPMAIGVPFLMGYGAWLASLTPSGLGPTHALGMVHAFVSAFLAVLYFIQLGAQDFPEWLNALLFLVYPIVAGLAFIFTGIGVGGGRGGLIAFYGLPFAYFFVCFLLYGLLGQWTKLIDERGGRIVLLVVVAVVLLVAAIVGGIFGAKALRDIRIPEQPDLFAAESPHLVRLFDEGTLFETDGETYFPSGERDLMRLWWTGGGTMHIRVRRYALEFSLDGGHSIHQVVRGPIEPMTLAEWANFLNRTVQDAAGVTGDLQFKIIHPGDDYQLPAGGVFSDHADIVGVENEEGRVREARRFIELGTREADDAYLLRHAPKVAQSLRFGRQGPSELFDVTHPLGGPGTLSSAGVVVTGDPNTRFTVLFRSSDYILAYRADGTLETGVVDAVVNDHTLNLRADATFAANVPAGTGYERWRSGSRWRLRLVEGSGTVRLTKGSQEAKGTFTRFKDLFLPGDYLEVTKGDDQVQLEIKRVIDDTHLELMSAPAITLSGKPSRYGADREEKEGYRYVADPALDKPGGSLMEAAAEVGALLCMAAVPAMHGVPSVPELVASLGADRARVGEVMQVFRNWNLDRRRVNEWRMMVAGDAVSEQSGVIGSPPDLGSPPDAHRWDPALGRPTPLQWRPDLALTPSEAVANRLGWVDLLRKWTELVESKDDVLDAAPTHPDELPRRELSRALAWLLDMPEPTSVRP